MTLRRRTRSSIAVASYFCMGPLQPSSLVTIGVLGSTTGHHVRYAVTPAPSASRRRDVGTLSRRRSAELIRSPLNVTKRGHANGPSRSPLSAAWYSGGSDEHRIKHGTGLRPASSAPRLLCAATGLPAAALYCCQSRQGCGWQRGKRGRRGSRLRSNRRQCGARCGDWRYCGRRCRRRSSGRPAFGRPVLLIAQQRTL
jgi:hypothetical protein